MAKYRIYDFYMEADPANWYTVGANIVEELDFNSKEEADAYCKSISEEIWDDKLQLMHGIKHAFPAYTPLSKILEEEYK
jgi:hypothetical protein